MLKIWCLVFGVYRTLGWREVVRDAPYVGLRGHRSLWKATRGSPDLRTVSSQNTFGFSIFFLSLSAPFSSRPETTTKPYPTLSSSLTSFPLRIVTHTLEIAHVRCIELLLWWRWEGGRKYSDHRCQRTIHTPFSFVEGPSPRLSIGCGLWAAMWFCLLAYLLFLVSFSSFTLYAFTFFYIFDFFFLFPIYFLLSWKLCYRRNPVHFPPLHSCIQSSVPTYPTKHTDLFHPYPPQLSLLLPSLA